ncbi:MAG: hypothetical protein ACREQ5_25750, partial [Candidatus Dormibacteria bacterium]
MDRFTHLVALTVLVTACGSTAILSTASSPATTSVPPASTPRPSGDLYTDRTPPSRIGASLSTDGDSVLLLGGADYYGHIFQDQWHWQTGGLWARDESSPIPPGRFGPASVWDPRSKSVLMVGGTFVNTGVDPAVGRVTWVHKDGRWTDHHPAHVPTADAALVYDPDTGTVLLLGASKQVWSWDGSDWALLSTPSAPPGRLGAAAVYDPIGHVVLLFGGHLSLQESQSDTWAYDGATWQELHPATIPTGGDAV